MLERGHLEAMHAATNNAVVALEKGDAEATDIARKQIEAVSKINLATTRILESLGIADIAISDIGTSRSLSTSTISEASASGGDASVAEGSFGEQLNRYRKGTGLPSNVLLELVGVSPSTVSRAESGKGKLRLKTVLSFVKVMRLTREQAEKFVESAGLPIKVLNLPAEQLIKLNEALPKNKKS